MGKETENSHTMAETSDIGDQRIIDRIRVNLERGLPAGSPEFEENQIPRCYSPSEFLTYLRGTNEYKRGIFLREQELLERRPDAIFITEELQTSFEGTSTFWTMLLSFGQDVIHLSYRPEYYSEEFRESMNNYLDIVRKSKAGGGKADRELIEGSDRARYAAHARAARHFVNQGLTEDMRTARYLVRLLMIDLGTEYIHDARLSVERNSPGMVFHEEITWFSSATIRAVQGLFASAHSDVRLVDKRPYIQAQRMITTAGTRDPENNRRSTLI